MTAVDRNKNLEMFPFDFKMLLNFLSANMVTKTFGLQSGI